MSYPLPPQEWNVECVEQAKKPDGIDVFSLYHGMSLLEALQLCKRERLWIFEWGLELIFEKAGMSNNVITTEFLFYGFIFTVWESDNPNAVYCVTSMHSFTTLLWSHISWLVYVYEHSAMSIENKVLFIFLNCG